MIQALLVAVVAFLASIDEQTFGACMMSDRCLQVRLWG